MGNIQTCLNDECLKCLEILNSPSRENVDNREIINGYYKEKELVDGLEVYIKKVDLNNVLRGISENNYTCPLCCEPLTESQINEMFNNFKLIKSNIASLSAKFIGTIERKKSIEDADIFSELESIDDEINKNKNEIEIKKLRYYKYKCETNNKEIYLYNNDSCGDNRYSYRYYKSYIEMEWKTNENLKKNLINERKMIINDEIEKPCLKAWNDLCIKKEATNYQKALNLCNQAASDSYLSNMYGDGVNYLYAILNKGVYLLKYNVNIFNLAKYVANFNSKEKNFFLGRIGERTMDDKEEKEYEEFKKNFFKK